MKRDGRKLRPGLLEALRFYSNITVRIGISLFLGFLAGYALDLRMRTQPCLLYTSGRFRDFVFALMTDIYVAPEDAAFVINPDDTVSVRPSNTGRYLDPEDLGNHIKEVALKRTDRTVVLNVKPMVPALTTEQANAMNIRECIGRFSTNFNPENKPRVHNIREAARAIDGVILGPGETFSFNEIVGPRSAEAGYLEAPVMVDDDLVPGIGGGICQVSSTLYNAVLLANLSIVARSNHSMLPSYIQAGRDAAVAYDYMDFKFRNDGSSHILVKLIVADNSITAKVYGYAPDGYHVSIVCLLYTSRCV